MHHVAVRPWRGEGRSYNYGGGGGGVELLGGASPATPPPLLDETLLEA